MAFTVFYSWQSDSPKKTNRNFIEKALEKAIKNINAANIVDPAKRADADDPDQQFAVDKDTQGVPGSPEIVSTILKKIESATAFVGDVTFVGNASSDPQRLQPNPNVLIEYGYALHALKHERVIKVMNTHFGAPSAISMPFDMRHLRWPIQYCLSGDEDEAQRKGILDALVKDFEMAIRAIDRAQVLPKVPEFQLAPSIPTAPYAFAAPGSVILRREGGDPNVPGSRDMSMPAGSCFYLRVFPVSAVTRRRSTDLQKQVVDRQLWPMGRFSAFDYDQNAEGFLVFSTSGSVPKQIRSFVQFFESGEIWTADFAAIHDGLVWGLGIEQYIPAALAKYADYLRETYSVSTVGWIAGMHGVEGQRAVLPPLPDGRQWVDPYTGTANKSWLESRGTFAKDQDAMEALRQFLEDAWANFKTNREDVVKPK
jgi:hypothetical protein